MSFEICSREGGTCGFLAYGNLSLAFGAEVLDYFLVLISFCLLRQPPLFPAGHFMYAGSSSRCFLVADSKTPSPNRAFSSVLSELGI
jgi:hypothetical protein